MDPSQLSADAAGVAPVVDGLTMPPELKKRAPVAAAAGEALEPTVEELDDGSAVYYDEDELKKAARAGKRGEFSENLVETLEERELQEIGMDLMDCIESDQRVRENRDKQYAEGLKRTGLDGSAPGGAEFDGASRAVHPMLAKGCVDFASRAMKELYPASGPCRTQIIGESNDLKVDKADRKRQYMNWQMTTQVEENRAEFERLLSQLPLGGSQYKRWWWDPVLKRPRTQTVYVDDVFMPYDQNDFYSCYRVTHRQYVNEQEYDARVASGLYRDLALVPPPTGFDDKSKARAVTDRIEGVEEDTAAYQEGLREIYQVYVNYTVEGDTRAGDRPTPYIAHIDKWSGRVLGLFRNWREKDPTFAKKHWMVEYTFIPWRGPYGVGLFHLIGSLSISATGAVRAILDAAHIQNFPGGLKLKGGRNSGQSIQVNATELAEISGPPGVDDIRKVVMAFPFNGPSAVLFQLVEWLTQQAESVITVASERIVEGGGADMPVGTAMALIEHDSTNFSSIHARAHNSLKHELAILHRLNAENLTDEEVVEDLGELVVHVDDFKGPVDIIPVSDPSIFSEAQRYAQLQAVLQLKNDPQLAPLFKPDRVLQRALKLLQIPAPEELAALPKDPTRLSPLEENYWAAAHEPRPLKVYEDQEDVLHLQSHVVFMTSPIFGGTQLIGGQALPTLIAHCKEHILNLYRKHTVAATQAMLTVAKSMNLALTQEDAEGRASALADGAIAQALGSMIMPGLMKAQELATGMQAKPSVTPDVQAKIDADKVIAEQKIAADKEIAAAKDTGDTERRRMELAYEEGRDQHDRDANAHAAQVASSTEQFRATMEQRTEEIAAQLQLMRDNANNQAKVTLAEVTGHVSKELEVLKAVLGSLLPDISKQMGQLAERTDQVSGDLDRRISDMDTSSKEDKATIREMMKLLQQLTTAKPGHAPGQLLLGNSTAPASKGTP